MSQNVTETGSSLHLKYLFRSVDHLLYEHSRLGMVDPRRLQAGPLRLSTLDNGLIQLRGYPGTMVSSPYGDGYYFQSPSAHAEIVIGGPPESFDGVRQGFVLTRNWNALRDISEAGIEGYSLKQVVFVARSANKIDTLSQTRPRVPSIENLNSCQKLTQIKVAQRTIESAAYKTHEVFDNVVGLCRQLHLDLNLQYPLQHPQLKLGPNTESVRLAEAHSSGRLHPGRFVQLHQLSDQMHQAARQFSDNYGQYKTTLGLGAALAVLTGHLMALSAWSLPLSLITAVGVEFALQHAIRQHFRASQVEALVSQKLPLN